MTVVDASVLVDALAGDNARGAAARHALRSAAWLAAPDLIDVETVAGLRRSWLGGEIAEDRFRRGVEALQGLRIERHSSLPRVQRAFDLRGNVTPYDAAYVALAEALGCELVTRDAKLAAAPGPRCPVRLLGAA